MYGTHCISQFLVDTGSAQMYSEILIWNGQGALGKKILTGAVIIFFNGGRGVMLDTSFCRNIERGCFGKLGS